MRTITTAFLLFSFLLPPAAAAATAGSPYEEECRKELSLEGKSELAAVQLFSLRRCIVKKQQEEERAAKLLLANKRRGEQRRVLRTRASELTEAVEARFQNERSAALERRALPEKYRDPQTRQARLKRHRAKLRVIIQEREREESEKVGE